MVVIQHFLSELYHKVKPKMAKENMISNLMVIFTLLIVLPMFIVGFYAHPTLDDFSFGRNTFHAILDNQGIDQILSIIRATGQTVSEAYTVWSGYYTGAFLAALRPNIFNENLAFINTMILLGTLIICVFYCFHKIFTRILVFSKHFAKMAACITVILLVEFVPSAAEMFYWYTAGITYTFLFALAGVLLTNIACAMREKRISNVSLCLNMLLAIFVGGGILPVNVPTLALIFVLCIDLWCQKKYDLNFKIKISLLGVIFLVGILVGSLAPSTFWRLGELENQISIPYALCYSVYGVFSLMVIFFSKELLVGILLTVILTLCYIKRVEFKFEHPFFTALVTFCVLVAAYFPIYYGTGFVFQYTDTRYKSILFFEFIICLMFNVIYYTGWIYQKQKSRKETFAVAFGAVILVMVLTGTEREVEAWSIRGLKDLANGTLVEYDRQMDARTKEYMDINVQVVTIKHPTVYSPLVSLPEPTNAEGSEWIAEGIRGYYRKEAIIVEE